MAQKITLYLKEWRKAAKLTQEKLAEKIDMSAPHISNLERGVSDVTGEMLVKLAGALNCEPHDLITRRPTDGVSVLDIWREVPDQYQSIAIDILRVLSKK